jgi:hypothetical protein
MSEFPIAALLHIVSGHARNQKFTHIIHTQLSCLENNCINSGNCNSRQKWAF